MGGMAGCPGTAEAEDSAECTVRTHQVSRSTSARLWGYPLDCHIVDLPSADESCASSSAKANLSYNVPNYAALPPLLLQPFCEQIHVQIARRLNPVLVDFHCQRPDQP